MTPAIFLLGLVVLTVGARAMSLAARSRFRHELRALAAEWRMKYTPVDVFGLAARVLKSFPVPGAAELRIRDVVYGAEGDHYRWVFTAEYTTGATRGQRRTWRACTFTEPREGAAGNPAVNLGSDRLSLIEQYQSLHKPA